MMLFCGAGRNGALAIFRISDEYINSFLGADSWAARHSLKQGIQVFGGVISLCVNSEKVVKLEGTYIIAYM
jgi:hypothetical protein